MDTPEWPKVEGPRILSLVGNDLRIDVRSRKTAASLAGSGFSVIAMGVTSYGDEVPSEGHHGALLYRVPVALDGGSTPFLFRFSKANLRDFFFSFTEKIKGKLRELKSGTKHSDHDSRKKLVSRLINKVRVAQLNFAAKVFWSFYRLLARQNSHRLFIKSWRWTLPEMHRYEASLGPVIDLLKPDLIHVHDVFHLGLAARAVTRAKQAQRDIKLVYDVHEYIPGLPIEDRKRCGYENLENEYAPLVDAFITVSPGLEALIEKRFGVPSAVVLNAPDLISAINTTPLREVVNLSSDDTLMVYVGGIAPHRGAELLLETMQYLAQDFHLVFVSASTSGYIASLRERSIKDGIAGRVHFAPFVEPEAVVSYISSADISLIPLSREIQNYEVALPNKLFQSIHAGVPLAVSDNPDMKQFVKENGVGEVFVGDNPKLVADAINKVVNSSYLYAEAIGDERLLFETSWEYQSTLITNTYNNLGVSPHA